MHADWGALVSWLPDFSAIDWAQSLPYIAAIIVIIAGLIGIFLAIITLPGAWIAIAVSLLVWWWQPQLFEWWTFLIAILIAGLGELIEFAASALGAAKAGSTRKGAIGAAIGTLVGAIAGIPFWPPIGTIVGGVLGAALGAFIAERGAANRTWGQAGKASVGAAIGRIIATIAKGIIAGGVALVLAIATFW